MFGMFGKKEASPPQRRIPTGKVLSLSSRGVPEPEIIRILKDEGYTPTEVDKAMTTALKGAVGGQASPPQPPPQASAPPQGYPEPSEEPLSDMPPPEVPPQAPPEVRATGYQQQPPAPRRGEDDLGPLPPQPRTGPPPEAEDMRDMPPPPRDDDMAMRGPLDLPEVPGLTDRRPSAGPAPMGDEIPSQDSYRPGMPPGQEPLPRLPEKRTAREKKDDRRRAIEELVEGIIEEKWDAMQASLLDLENKLTLMENKVDLLENSIKRLEGDKKEDMNNIEEKIDTYRSAIGEMSTRMESIEGAMKNSLSPLMQSVRDLSNSVKDMKSKKKKSVE
jgi:hypothetical protein